MTQQTERDETPIDEKRILADILEAITKLGTVGPWHDDLLRAAMLLRGDEPAKPDRYLQVWKEAKDAYIYPNRTEHESDQVAAAVLRKHFAPPSEVVEAAKYVKREYHPRGCESAHILADFILKGDV